MEEGGSMQVESSPIRSNQFQKSKCQDSVTDAVIEKPKQGMEFDTYDALHDYYARYAKQQGFAVCKRTSKKGKDGKVKYVAVQCIRAGKPCNRGANPLKPRPQSKVNCPAKVRATFGANDKFILSFVCLEHNHERSPGKVRHCKSNRKIDEETKKKLEYHDTAGIKLNKTFDMLLIEAGGPENLSFSQRDCRNYLSKVRRLKLVEGDAEAMTSYFMRMKADNEEFFYSMDLDEEGRLRNVFWADARSRAACKEFGDVVTFDTTYLVNRYDMPFAPFVGVNHHGNSVLLGCGLVSHEDTQSFVWLFKNWLACMHDTAPKAIITDQCMAMKNAIQHVFPESHHRWCIWHIMKKVPEKLSGYKEFKRINYCMGEAVYDSLTAEEFEDVWFEFISKYDLHSNTWLEGLYKERERWVPAFVKHIFWAGMSSTQRSESINSYFDGFINSRTTLKQFVEQYENALTKKVEIESQQDANSWSSFIPCISEDDELEKQFQSVYTNDKVRELQVEIRRILKCQIWTRSEDEYEIKEWISIGEDDKKRKKRVLFKVSFNEETKETECNCQNFQFKGMVCAHQLIVWNDLGISKVPDKYVFRRWCKNVKRAHNKVRIGYDKSSKRTEPCLTENMYKAFKEVVESVEDSKEKYEKVMTMCRELKQEFDDASDICASNVAVETAPDDDCVLVPSNHATTILDPEPVRRRGRPPFKRKVSFVERISKSRRRKLTACPKAKGNTKNRASSNEHDDVHQRIVNGAQHNVSTVNHSIMSDLCLQNYVPSQISEDWNISQGGALDQLRHVGPIMSDPSLQKYVPSQISEAWNISQGGALDQLRHVEYFAISSQIGHNGNSPPLHQTMV